MLAAVMPHLAPINGKGELNLVLLAERKHRHEVTIVPRMEWT
jgi:hypothetical protein